MQIRKVSTIYSRQGLYDKAKEWMLKYYNKRDQMPRRLMLRACKIMPDLFENTK